MDENGIIKVVKAFLIVGINPEIISLKKTSKDQNNYIIRIDIIKNKLQSQELTIEKNKNEKLLRLKENGDYWLRIFYTQKYTQENYPITTIKHVECTELNNEYVVRFLVSLSKRTNSLA